MNLLAMVFLWSFTILLGVDLGAGLYEARVNAAGWSSAMTSRTPDGEAYMRFAPNAGARWCMTRYRELPADFVASRTATWTSLNWVRVVMTFAAWLAALRAMTLG